MYLSRVSEGRDSCTSCGCQLRGHEQRASARCAVLKSSFDSLRPSDANRLHGISRFTHRHTERLPRVLIRHLILTALKLAYNFQSGKQNMSFYWSCCRPILLISMMPHKFKLSFCPLLHSNSWKLSAPRMAHEECTLCLPCSCFVLWSSSQLLQPSRSLHTQSALGG